MTLQVYVPEKKEQNTGLNKLLNIGKIGVGTAQVVYGDPLNKAGGAMNIASGVQGLKGGPSKTTQPISMGSTSTAIDRKMDTEMTIKEQAQLFRDVDNMMPELPEQLNKELAPPLYSAVVQLMARARAQKQGGMQS